MKGVKGGSVDSVRMLRTEGTVKQRRASSIFQQNGLGATNFSNFIRIYSHHQQQKANEWLPTKGVSQCMKCQTSFKFYMRKFNCRICGKIYCKKCCKKHIFKSQPSFGAQNIKPKPMVIRKRMCETCHQKITMQVNDFLDQCKVHLHNFERAEHGSYEITSEAKAKSEVDQANQRYRSITAKANLLALKSGQALQHRMIESKFEPDPEIGLHFASDGGNEAETLGAELNQHMNEVIDHSLVLNQIARRWHNILSRFAYKAVQNVQHFSRMSKDCMQFADYISIHKMLTPRQQPKASYITGVLVHKNIADKKMIKDIKNPRVLVIGSTFEFTRPLNDGFTSIENMLTQELHFTNTLIARLRRLGPNVIILEGGSSMQVIQALRENGITLINNVKPKDMVKIARFTETVVVPTHELVDARVVKLGTCEEFRVIQNHYLSRDEDTRSKNKRRISQDFEDLGGLSRAEIEKRTDDSLAIRESRAHIMFAGCKADRGCTILVSGPSLEELKRVKTVIKQMITQMRNLYLEKEYFKTVGIDPTSFAIKDDRLKREYLRMLSQTESREANDPKSSNFQFTDTLDKMQLSPDDSPEELSRANGRQQKSKYLDSVTTSSESERQRAFGEAGLLQKSEAGSSDQDDQSEGSHSPEGKDSLSQQPQLARGTSSYNRITQQVEVIEERKSLAESEGEADPQFELSYGSIKEDGPSLTENQGGLIPSSETSSKMTPVFRTASRFNSDLSPIRQTAHESSKHISGSLPRISSDDLLQLKPTEKADHSMETSSEQRMRADDIAIREHHEAIKQCSPFLISRIGVERYLQKNNIVVTQVMRSMTDKAIQDPSAHFLELHNKKNNEKDIYKYVNCICEEPKMFRLEFYGKNDWPLGRYIIDLAKQATQVCKLCNRLKNKHELSFYHGLGRVNFKLDQQEYLSKLVQEVEGLYTYMPGKPSNVDSKTGLQTSLAMSSTDPNISTLGLHRSTNMQMIGDPRAGYLQVRESDKLSSDITELSGGLKARNVNRASIDTSFSIKNTYPIVIAPNSHFDMIEENEVVAFSCCKICRRRVSQQVRINDGFFQFSFGRFLEQYFYNANLAHRQFCASSYETASGAGLKFECNHRAHRDLVRVFKTAHSLVIVDYEPVEPYKFLPNMIIKHGPATPHHIKNMVSRFCRDFSETGRQVQVFIEGVLAQLRTIISKFNKIMIVKHKELLKYLEEKTIWMLESFIRKRDDILSEINDSAPSLWKHSLDTEQMRRKCALFFLQYRAIIVKVDEIKRKIGKQINLLNDVPVISERKQELEKKGIDGSVLSGHSGSIMHQSKVTRSTTINHVLHQPQPSSVQSPTRRMIEKRVSLGIRPQSDAINYSDGQSFVRIDEEDIEGPKNDYTFGKMEVLSNYKQGQLLLPLGVNEVFIPFRSDDFGSMIAYVLHSHLYYEFMIRNNFLEVESHVKLTKGPVTQNKKKRVISPQNTFSQSESDHSDGASRNTLPKKKHPHHHHHHHAHVLKIPEKYNVFRKEVSHEKIESELLSPQAIHFVFSIDTSRPHRMTVNVLNDKAPLYQKAKQSHQIYECGLESSEPKHMRSIDNINVEDLSSFLCSLQDAQENLGYSAGSKMDVTASGTMLTAAQKSITLNTSADSIASVPNLQRQDSKRRTFTGGVGQQEKQNNVLNDLIRQDCVDEKVVVEVHAFYVKQFEALRKVACSTDSFDFIKSIYKAYDYRAHGGKSNAKFLRSSDKKYIFKVMKKNEFKMFLEMAPHYFTYMCKHYFHQLPSLLCKIVGIFKIVKTRYGAPGKAEKAHILVQENLAYNFPMEGTQIYDLKGSTANRFMKGLKSSAEVKNSMATSQRSQDNGLFMQSEDAHQKLKEELEKTEIMPPRDSNMSETEHAPRSNVKHDTNFLEDRDGEPIPIHYSVWKNIDFSLHNDSLSLANRNVVDYSLLTLINPQKKLIRFGIIDYVRLYTWDKKLESIGKYFIKQNEPTIINPNKYKRRFYEMMKHSLIGIYGALTCPEQ